MKLLEIKVNKREEVINVLTKEIKKQKLTTGAIVSVIGAVDECQINDMKKNNAMKDVFHQYKEPMELSGNGEIKYGKPHIHCILSRESGETVGGHLHRAVVKSWFVNIFVLVK